MCHLRVCIIFSPRIFVCFYTNYRCSKHYQSSLSVNIYFTKTFGAYLDGHWQSLLYIWFRNEAHFWQEDFVNKQSCHIWANENLHKYDIKFLHPQRLTVWAVPVRKPLLAPFLSIQISLERAMVKCWRRKYSHKWNIDHSFSISSFSEMGQGRKLPLKH